MSGFKKFVGLLIGLVMFGTVFPALFYLASRALDDQLGFSPVFNTPNSIFAAAFALLIGLFWVTWAYSYIHFVGKGSPVEAFGVALYPTQKLITTGPYAYTRNPMVLGYMFILLGIAFIGNSVSGFALVLILALLAVLYLRRFEESALIRRFGDKYIAYKKVVPLLIPTLKPRTPPA